MEKILADTNAREVNDYLSKGWKVKMMNTPVSLGGSSSMLFPSISLYVVLEKDDEKIIEEEQAKANSEKAENEATDAKGQILTKNPERPRCCIDGCDGWVHKEGMCHFHYFQKYNHF